MSTESLPELAVHPAQQVSLPAVDDRNTRSAMIWLITVSAMLHFVSVVLAPPLQSANDRSRWCTVRSLIEERTYRIDHVRQLPGWDTIDLILKDGHFYSTKPPLMATWVAGVVAAVMAVTGWNFTSDLQPIMAVTLLIINWLPFTVGLVWLTNWLRRSGWRPETQLFVMTVAALGTLVSPFLATLNNHTPAALGVLLALLCWLTPADHRGAWSYGRFFLWGFAAGWAACHDLPAAALTLAMFVFATVESRQLTLLGFLPGAALPALALLACNYLALGSLSPAYSGYGGETYRFLYEGVPSYWLNPQGIDRNLDSPLGYFLHCTVGHHGWWSLTPVWLLLFCPLSGVTRSCTDWERLVLAMTLSISAVVLAFYLSRTENYNYGGVSCGLRWAVFLTPLWILALGTAVDRLPQTRFWQGCAIVCLAGSLFSAWYPNSRPWQQPWIYQLASRNGWVRGQEPPPPFERPLHSWFATLPTSTSSMPEPWVEFQSTLPNGINARLRLTLKGEQQIGSRRCAIVESRRTEMSGSSEVQQYLIDRAAFTAGRPAAECLVWADSSTTAQHKLADLTWFRGLPAMRPYNPGYERYLKTSLRRDALPCQRAAAQVDFAPSNVEQSLRYRCDLWLSPEVPFGTARVDWTVTNPVDGEILQRESWVVVDSTPRVASSTPVTVEMFSPPGRPILPQVRSVLSDKK